MTEQRVAGQKDTRGGVQPSGAASTARTTPAGSGPPAGGRHRASHLAIAEQLREQPGVWGTVATYGRRRSGHTVASAIRRAYGSSFAVYGPAGSYEARVVGLPYGAVRVEARCIRPGTGDEAWADAVAALTGTQEGGDGHG